MLPMPGLSRSDDKLQRPQGVYPKNLPVVAPKKAIIAKNAKAALAAFVGAPGTFC